MAFLHNQKQYISKQVVRWCIGNVVVSDPEGLGFESHQWKLFFASYKNFFAQLKISRMGRNGYFSSHIQIFWSLSSLKRSKKRCDRLRGSLVNTNHLNWSTFQTIRCDKSSVLIRLILFFNS